MYYKKAGARIRMCIFMHSSRRIASTANVTFWSIFFALFCTDAEIPPIKTACGRKTRRPGNQGEALPARSRCQLKNQRQKKHQSHEDRGGNNKTQQLRAARGKKCACRDLQTCRLRSNRLYRRSPTACNYDPSSTSAHRTEAKASSTRQDSFTAPAGAGRPRPQPGGGGSRPLHFRAGMLRDCRSWSKNLPGEVTVRAEMRDPSVRHVFIADGPSRPQWRQQQREVGSLPVLIGQAGTRAIRGRSGEHAGAEPTTDRKV